MLGTALGTRASIQQGTGWWLRGLPPLLPTLGHSPAAAPFNTGEIDRTAQLGSKQGERSKLKAQTSPVWLRLWPSNGVT